MKFSLPILSCIAALWPGLLSAEECLKEGQLTTLRGIATPQQLTMADDTISTVWILTTDSHLCVEDEISGNSPVRDTSVQRVQIIGSPPPRDIEIELKGTISTGNVTQYYAEKTAIKVISGLRVKPKTVNNASISIPPPLAKPTPEAIQKAPLTTDDKDNKINRALVDCVLQQARTGGYSSLDGGKSAVRLLGACYDQYSSYVEACRKTGDTEGNCSLKGGLVAQLGLKLLNM